MFRDGEKVGLFVRSNLYEGAQFVPEKSIFKKIAALCGLVLFITTVGCNKSGELGIAVLPEDDMLSGIFSDTTTLLAYTVPADSLLTWNLSSFPQKTPLLSPLGSYIDPVFGQSTASFYVKFSMPTNNINFGNGDGFKPDSLVMTIAYNGFYGEAPLPQTIMVYQLDSMSTLDEDGVYYTASNVLVNLTDLGGATINPAIGDVSVSFKLNDPIFTESDSSFLTNADFQNFIKGFYILTNPFSPGGMLYMDINSSTTKLTLYYDDSASFDFVIDGKSVWFNRFHHMYDGTAIEMQYSDPSLGNSLVYVQPMGGTMVKIEMPYITNWDSIAIGKAELVLSVYDDGTLDTYGVPDNLFILAAEENSVITDQFEGATHFGGTYDAANKTYTFNIARYVHELIYEGRTNDGIYLIVPNNLLTSGSVVSANRVILGGPEHSQLGMKLNLIYTKI